MDFLVEYRMLIKNKTAALVTSWKHLIWASKQKDVQIFWDMITNELNTANCWEAHLNALFVTPYAWVVRSLHQGSAAEEREELFWSGGNEWHTWNVMTSHGRDIITSAVMTRKKLYGKIVLEPQSFAQIPECHHVTSLPQWHHFHVKSLCYVWGLFGGRISAYQPAGQYQWAPKIEGLPHPYLRTGIHLQIGFLSKWFLLQSLRNTPCHSTLNS